MQSGTAPQLRKALRGRSPDLRNERELWAAGHDVLVGMDEVGRGSWAGPLVLGAVVVPRDRRVYKIRDSKQLTEREREALFDRIKDYLPVADPSGRPGGAPPPHPGDERALPGVLLRWANKILPSLMYGAGNTD